MRKQLNKSLSIDTHTRSRTHTPRLLSEIFIVLFCFARHNEKLSTVCVTAQNNVVWTQFSQCSIGILVPDLREIKSAPMGTARLRDTLYTGDKLALQSFPLYFILLTSTLKSSEIGSENKYMIWIFIYILEMGGVIKDFI